MGNGLEPHTAPATVIDDEINMYHWIIREGVESRKIHKSGYQPRTRSNLRREGMTYIDDFVNISLSTLCV